MIISLIVAADLNNTIGGGNTLLWNLPADMKHFREKTKGHAVIMGRKTYESIGRALPGRRNFVVSRDTKKTIDGCEIVPSIDEALRRALESGEEEAFIIGGGQIYAESLPLADRIYLTRVHASFKGDVVFPAIDEQEWKEVSAERHEADSENPHAVTFLKYERKR
ncbi:MAG: dihydrofolate reductase [Candidatus Peregrinibacteria bacterium]